MKKAIFFICTICCLLIYSCNKNSETQAGSWTFKSQTYKASFASWVLGSFTGYTGNSYPTGSVTFTFNDSLPTGSSTYHVSNISPPPPGYVFVLFTDTAVTRTYASLPSNTNTVTVSASGDGKKTSISFPAVQMRSSQNSSDSSLISGTLTQTH